MTFCICGCGRTADVLHHVVYQAELRRVARDDQLAYALCGDPRGMVPIAQPCHDRHHSRSKPLPLRVLPDEAFEFAAEVRGAPRAYEYLRRRYVGEDTRLDALLDERRAA